MIVSVLFKVVTVSFAKYVVEFIIPIALLKEFSSYEFLRLLKSLTCEDALAKRVK